MIVNNIQFYNSFAFTVFRHSAQYRHTDNSRGIDCHYLARLKRGKARFVSEDKQEMWLKEGDVFYLPYGLKYHSYWQGDENGEIEWESYRFNVFAQSTDKEYVMQKISVDNVELALFDEQVQDLTVSCSSVGRLYIILARLLPKMEERKLVRKDGIMESVMQFISEHQDFKVSELARFCGMSESGLYAFVRKNAGMTPVDLKNQAKAQRAVELLQTTNLSVEEVSTELGFGSSAYLRKILAKHCGKTPMQIRKEAKII